MLSGNRERLADELHELRLDLVAAEGEFTRDSIALGLKRIGALLPADCELLEDRSAIQLARRIKHLCEELGDTIDGETTVDVPLPDLARRCWQLSRELRGGQATCQEPEGAPGDDAPADAPANAPAVVTAGGNGDTIDAPPAPLLLSWREITDALGQRNTLEFRGKLKRLSKGYDGPINFPGQGAQPKVDREKLIAWWNALDARMAELDARKRDEVETVKNQYRYGADGQVVPDIGGGVKGRRGGST